MHQHCNMGPIQLLRWHNIAGSVRRNRLQRTSGPLLAVNHDKLENMHCRSKCSCDRCLHGTARLQLCKFSGRTKSLFFMCCTAVAASTSHGCRCICCCQQQQWVPSCQPEDPLLVTSHNAIWGIARSAHFAAPSVTQPARSAPIRQAARLTCSRQNSLHTRNKGLSHEYQ